eukprot:g80556.t1
MSSDIQTNRPVIAIVSTLEQSMASEANIRDPTNSASRMVNIDSDRPLVFMRKEENSNKKQEPEKADKWVQCRGITGLGKLEKEKKSIWPRKAIYG